MVDTGPYMEFIAESVTATADQEYTENEFAAPTGRSENIAMLIHQVALQFTTSIDTAAIGDRIVMCLTAKSKGTTLPTMEDPDVIAYVDYRFNALTSGGNYEKFSEVFNFAPAVLFSRSKLYVGIYHSGMSSARSAACKVGYTLQKVPAGQFIAALTD